MIPDFVDVEIVRDAKVTAIGFPSRMLSQSMAPAFEGQIHSGGPVPHGGSLACAIASVVESLQPYAPTPSLIAMAEILGMHPRYLQRRLANEGCRYTEVVKQVRFKIACRLLRAGELSIKQIAEELNYSGTNNFTRSFRSLAGVPPSSFQKKNAG